MLGIFRRHQKRCAHRHEGRKYRRCQCPVWVDGHLNGVEIHQSLHTRDWQKAQGIVREWEATGERKIEANKSEAITIEQAWLRFTADLEARKLHESTIRKYRLLSRQMKEFAFGAGLRLLRELDLDSVGRFRCQWHDGALSAAKKLERLRAFFRFAQRRRWIGENPASELKSPRIPIRATLPFTHDEMTRTLSAVDTYVKKASPSGRENGMRLRALVLLLRYTGMRISDVINLTADRIVGNRLFLYTQKTGEPVNTILPDFVLSALEDTPRKSEKFFFWSGIGKLESTVRSWQTRLRKLFEFANVEKGHAHRFRDTFAVDLLLAGIPMERVSVLLGHHSLRVTEKHYAPWVRSRQLQLESDLATAWSRDPIALTESKVTQKLRANSAPIN
jgi:integrase/recombinase XerD